MLNKKKIIFNQPLKISNRQQKKLSFDAVPLAPIPHRVVGFIVDWIIVLFLIGFAKQIIAGLSNTHPPLVVEYSVFLVAWIIYGFYFINFTSSTIGEKIVAIRPVDKKTGNRLSVKQGLLRSILGSVLTFPILIFYSIPTSASGSLTQKPAKWWLEVFFVLCLIPAISFAWSISTSTSQTLFDKLSNTVVIKNQKVEK